jgi:hypothetical protein
MKTINYLKMTVVFLTAALAGPVALASDTPFRGTLQAVESQSLVFPILSVDGTGGGKSTHLGKFTLTYEAEVNVLAGAGTGSMELVAANGDRVFADFSGQSTPTGTPGVVTILETATITGGTGRFVGATGTFVVSRTLTQATGITSGSFDGTIVVTKGN